MKTNSIKKGSIIAITAAPRCILGAAMLICSCSMMNAVEYKFTNPSGSNPANGAEVASSIGVDNISVIIPGGGEIGIEKINTGKTVKIEKDGENFMSLNTSDPNAVLFSDKDPNAIILNTGLLQEPGKYSVSIPEQLVTMAVDMSAVDTSRPEDEPLPIYMNTEYSFSFSIVAMPEFSISPLPGLYKPEQLKTFTLTFPEGTEIAIANSSKNPAIYTHLITNTGGVQSDLITTYSISITDNVVTFTANNVGNIQSLSVGLSREWDYFSIPKGLFSLSLDENTYSNPTLNFEKYDVRVPGADGFSISPAPADGLMPVDMKEFIISYPSNISVNSSLEVGDVAGYLKQTGTGETNRNSYSGYLFGTLIIKEINTEKRTMTLSIMDRENPSEYVDNINLMQTSFYCLNINTKVFTGNEKIYKAGLNFPGYGVIGKEDFQLSDIFAMVDYEPRKDLALKNGERLSGMELYYPFNVLVNKGSNKITLSYDGKEIYSVDANKIKIASGGDNYLNLDFKTDYKDQGRYTLNIPEGTFRQVSFGNYLNKAEKITVTIGNVTGVEEIETPSSVEDEITEYFTIDGVKVKDPVKGLYIVRKGSKSEKMIF